MQETKTKQRPNKQTNKNKKQMGQTKKHEKNVINEFVLILPYVDKMGRLKISA